jgi:HAD superfamily hydrolase (TIGR01549 family)
VRERSVIFWDFDGVIKESVDAKTEAYVSLFAAFGEAVAARVRRHHEENGGMSRFEKLPLYLSWAHTDDGPEEVSRYCERFAGLVRQAVLNSEWVPGVYKYLETQHERQRFILVSATPQGEMEEITRTLRIAAWFREIHGAPTKKGDAMAGVLARLGCRKEECLMIGDSAADLVAAQRAGVEFLLRRTRLNRDLQRTYAGPQCEDFTVG